MFSNLKEKLQNTIYVMVILVLFKMFFLDSLIDFVAGHLYLLLWLLAVIGWGIYTIYRVRHNAISDDEL